MRGPCILCFYEKTKNATKTARYFHSYDLALPKPALGTRCEAMLAMDTRILVVRMVPGFDDRALLNALTSRDLRAVVLELYGTGTAPSRRAGLVAALVAARDAGVLVVATTQCMRGGVVLGTYAVGQALLDAGVLSAGDMTTEAVATKLAFLFGKFGEDRAAVARLVTVSLRGELSHPDTYLKPFFEAHPTPVGRPARLSDADLSADANKASTWPNAPSEREKRQRRARDLAAGALFGAALALALCGIARARRR